MLLTTNYLVERLLFPLKFQHYTGGVGNMACFKTLNYCLGIFCYFEWLSFLTCHWKQSNQKSFVRRKVCRQQAKIFA